MKRGYESDGSDVSGVSHCSDAKRRRGRPRKDEEAYRLEMTPPTMNEVIRWNPDRIDMTTRFVTVTKIAQVLGMAPSILFNKYPRMFRVRLFESYQSTDHQTLQYSCDEDDKNILHDQNRLIRAPGRCYLLIAEDARQLVPPAYLWVSGKDDGKWERIGRKILSAELFYGWWLLRIFPRFTEQHFLDMCARNK